MRIKKKGQIEMFGLAFIVILISVGFFIFVAFKSQQEPKSPQKEFTNSKMASDFVLAIIDVNIEECMEYTVKDLIIDCAKDKRITCGIENSCIAVNKSIASMLNQTFTQKNMAFIFYSENLLYETTNVNLELFNFSNRNCTRNSPKGQTGMAIISLYPAQSNVYLNMNICYK